MAPKSKAGEEEDSLDCQKREKEARIVLEQELDSLKEELQRLRDYNSSLQQFNSNLLNDLKSATDSNLQSEREKSEILETSATDSFDEAFKQKVERQVQELTCELVRFKENMMRCTVVEADKLSSMEETCSSQRDQISVLQHQLAAANHKLEASAVLNVDILTLLKFYFHEDFRKTVVSAVPDLLRFSKLAIEAQGCDGTYLKKLSDYIVPAFVEALHKEPETKLIANMLDALSKCLQIFGPLLDENQVRSIVDEIKLVINASSSRKGKRTNTQDEQVFYQVGEVVGTLAKSFKASFLPFFDELWSYLMPMLGKDKTAQERRIASCIFDDVAEQCREAALRYNSLFAFWFQLLSRLEASSDTSNDDQVEMGDQEEESD
ncbi:importin-5 [Artemisia annua]|uniref:Importin-5 n=1 Tax=Artemisia annua TaxID=35608 RepID=A0A2U1ND89_ARTAN|nr:importin-5 [Artemisia annua]